jgi:replicative DNA helicase
MEKEKNNNISIDSEKGYKILLDLLFRLSLTGSSLFLKYFSVVKIQDADEISWEIIVETQRYISKYGLSPSFGFYLNLVKELSKKYPDFEYDYLLEKYDEKIDYYWDRYVNYYTKYYKSKIANSLTTSKERIDNILSRFHRLVRSLQDNIERDVYLIRGYPKFVEDFKILRDSEEDDIFPTGFKLIDAFSGGISKTDFVLFVARPQSFKTWILCKLAVNLSSLIHGGKILFFSKEMSKLQIQKRIYAIVGKINYERLKRSNLTDEELKELEKRIETLLKSEIIVVGKDEDLSYDTTFVRSKIVEHNPNIVLIDGLYLFAKNDEWTEHSAISRAFRDMSLTYEVPIIGTLQFSRKGFGRGNIAYSDSYEQDASVIIGIERLSMEDLGSDEEDSFSGKMKSVDLSNEVVLSILKIRDGIVDVKSRLSINFKDTTFFEKLISSVEDIHVKPKEKFISKPKEFYQDVLSIFCESLNKYRSLYFDDSLLEYDMERILKRDLGLDVYVVPKKEGIFNFTTKHKNDYIYYYQIGDTMMRLFIRDKVYVNFYKLNLKNPFSEEQGFSIRVVSAPMIYKFMEFFNEELKRYPDFGSKLQSPRRLELLLREDLNYRDPLLMLLMFLNGTISTIAKKELQKYPQELLLPYETIPMFFDEISQKLREMFFEKKEYFYVAKKEFSEIKENKEGINELNQFGYLKNFLLESKEVIDYEIYWPTSDKVWDILQNEPEVPRRKKENSDDQNYFDIIF